MPVFRYLAKASPEEIVTGEMQAESSDSLVAQLTKIGLYPVEISLREEPALRASHFRILSRKPARGALILFTRQMANMLETGITVHAALHILQKQTTPGPMRQILQDLEQRLRDGYPFSEACAARPKVFSKFYVNMLRAGETGGMLPLVIEHLADYLEREDDAQKQVRAALAYPTLMFGMGMITITLLLTFVVPRIVSMFDEIGQTLPLPTRILVSVSHFVSHNWAWMLLVVIVLIISIRMKRANPNFKLKLDDFKLRLPFFGSLIVQAETTQFARTLSALLGHGVPIHQAFEVVVAACKNLILQEQFRQAAEAIRRGERIGVSLLAGNRLPPLLGQMISIAEESNQLETVLEKIANSGIREVERRVAIFTRLLEPAMIVLLGTVIGFIVFAMMLPIFQMDFVVQ